MALPESARQYLARQIENVRRLPKKMRIVFPEGDDPRVIVAADRLARENVLEPILIGQSPATAAPGVICIDPENSPLTPKYAGLYYERRRSRGISMSEARSAARDRMHFAALMVANQDADAGVGGAVASTAVTFTAALRCIGTAPGVRTVSSFFIMAVQDRRFGADGLLMTADPAIVVDPTAVQLADIAVSTAGSTRAVLGVEPVVALLSFSTKGSARHKLVDKIQEALRIIRAREPGMHVDGELQADAAVVPAVGASKAPGSTVAGYANTLIFPDLNSANIGVKLVERLGNGANIGPFFQGLARPFNDLSRGCSADDIFNCAIVAALQANGGILSGPAP
jgi:phosphate acetyltransferase